jgi:hypothetical protein
MGMTMQWIFDGLPAYLALAAAMMILWRAYVVRNRDRVQIGRAFDEMATVVTKTLDKKKQRSSTKTLAEIVEEKRIVS